MGFLPPVETRIVAFPATENDRDGLAPAARPKPPVGTAPNNEPPTVALLSPTNGAVFKAPVLISLSATAADSDGTIQYVTFFANGALLGTDTTSPYGLTWTGAEEFNSIAISACAVVPAAAAFAVAPCPRPEYLLCSSSRPGG
jgi:hypothetical protein